MAALAKTKKLNPYLLVHPNCLPDFDGVCKSNQELNCVILGDAVDGFSYQNLNKVCTKGLALIAIYALA